MWKKYIKTLFEEYQWPIVTWIGRQLELRENEPELFLPYSIVLSRKGAKNGSFWWITQVGSVCNSHTAHSRVCKQHLVRVVSRPGRALESLWELVRDTPFLPGPLLHPQVAARWPIIVDAFHSSLRTWLSDSENQAESHYCSKCRNPFLKNDMRTDNPALGFRWGLGTEENEEAGGYKENSLSNKNGRDSCPFVSVTSAFNLAVTFLLTVL